MENKKPIVEESELDIENLRYFEGLSVEKKLEFVEQLQDFFNQTMPPENKEKWERLKEKGF